MRLIGGLTQHSNDTHTATSPGDCAGRQVVMLVFHRDLLLAAALFIATVMVRSTLRKLAAAKFPSTLVVPLKVHKILGPMQRPRVGQ